MIDLKWYNKAHIPPETGFVLGNQSDHNRHKHHEIFMAKMMPTQNSPLKIWVVLQYGLTLGIISHVGARVGSAGLLGYQHVAICLCWGSRAMHWVSIQMCWEV